MKLKELRIELNKARRAKDKEKMLPLQEVLAEAQNRFLKENEDTAACFKRIIKQYGEMYDALLKARRGTHSTSEKLNYLSSFMPTMINEDEYPDMVKEAIKKVSAVSMKDMGKVVSFLKEIHGESLDTKVVSGYIKDMLN